VLVLGCDQPALSNEHLSALLDGAGRIRSGCAATLTGGVRGIPAVVPGGWFLEATPTPDAGFRTRLRALPAPDIHLLQAPELAWDIDTPAQLATARAGGLVDP